MMSFIITRVVKVNVTVLNTIVLGVIMLSAIILSVMAQVLLFAAMRKKVFGTCD